MHKRISIIICIFLLVIMTGYPVLAGTKTVTLIINGIEQQCTPIPQIVNGHVMVPIRWLANSLGAAVKYDAQRHAVMVEQRPIIACIPERGIFLYTFKIQEGMYKGFVLENSGIRKYFEWENMITDIDEWKPQLILADTDEDDSEEFVIILTTGEGTGILKQDIHVIECDNIDEIMVLEPDTLFQNRIKTSITDSSSQRIFHLFIDNIKYDYLYKFKDDNDIRRMFERVSIGCVTKYHIVNKQLHTELSISISPSDYIGYLDVTYHYDPQSQCYQPGSILYQEY